MNRAEMIEAAFWAIKDAPDGELPHDLAIRVVDAILGEFWKSGPDDEEGS